MPFAHRLAVPLIPLLACGAGPTVAQTTEGTLDPVVVTASRSEGPDFSAPAAISVVGASAIAAAGPQVNLSESLVRVPGLTVLNRQNHAQDLQLSIRGFGARSTFGIRGVRLIVDGIPATMPDGQGQASSIALGSAGRIEVLRGPLAQLYGNAAGGVVQVFTEDDAPRPTVTASVAAGSFGQARAGLKYSTSEPGFGLTMEASHFMTDGYRDHSEARRGQFNVRLRKSLTPATRVQVVLNALEQGKSQDPLGLTRAQWEADPKQAVSGAYTQDTRKSVRQRQAGVVVDHRVDDRNDLSARVYAGQRDLDNALAIPPGPQASDTSSGGIVQFTRHYSGFGTQWQHRVPLGTGRSLKLTAGIELDRMSEERQGFVNTGGVAGAPKRDERNLVDSQDAFVQGAWDLHTDWTATFGVRHSRVRFETRDRFIVANTANGDDSGRFDHEATNPVAGLIWRVSPALNLYANAGRGFETPTFTELAYRPGGASGLNSTLEAARSRHLEAGAKWKPAAGHRIDAAVFDIRTNGELVVDTNTGGRSTYRNAGRTSRRGIEFAHSGAWTPTLRSTVAATLLRASFVDGIGASAGSPAVAAGNLLPATPRHTVFAELAWAPKQAPGGFDTAIELVRTGALQVNDQNTDAAPASTVLNWRAGFRQSAGPWEFSQWLRLNNVTDRRYAGSVIVNDGNQRYFEPALPRNWFVGLTARHSL